MSDLLTQSIQTARNLRAGTEILTPAEARRRSVLEERIRQLEITIQRLTDRISSLERDAEFYHSQKVRLHIINGPLTLIIGIVSERMDVPIKDIKSARRSKTVAMARHVFEYMARHHTECSLPTIGQFIRKDHTTVMYGIDQIEKMRKRDPLINQNLIELSNYIDGKLQEWSSQTPISA